MTREELVNQLLDNTSAMKRAMGSLYEGQINGLLLSRSQIELLLTIKHSQPVSCKVLAAQLYFTAGAISQLADGLDKHNLILREVHPNDRRNQSLRLSIGGEDLVKNIEIKRRAIGQRLTSTLDDNELKIWVRAQQKIIDQLKLEGSREKNKEKNEV